MDAWPILAAVLLGGLVLLSVVSAGAGKRHNRGPRRARGGSSSGPKMNKQQMRERWDQIKMTSQTGGSGLKSAMLDADKLFDQAMKQSGIPGETMGDRLKNARQSFDRNTYDNVWRAHKLRNTMAHEIGFDLVPSQVREALSDFERGLRELGVL
jgi:hypothetical protein